MTSKYPFAGEVVRLGDVCEVVTGNTPPTSNQSFYSSDDIRFYKPGDITESVPTELRDPESWLSERARNKARIVPSNSVLMTCIGTIGKVGITSTEAAFNQQINAAIPDEQLDSRYLAHQLSRKGKTIAYQANQAVVPILNKKSFMDIRIICPSLSAQRAIARKLDYLLELIDIAQKTTVLLDELVKSRFVETISRSPNTTVTTIGRICELINGDRGKNYPSGSDFVSIGVPFINAGHLEKGTVSFEKMNYITEAKYDHLRSGKTQPGDILYCLRGSLGKMAIVDFDHGAIASSLLIIRADRARALPVYVAQCLASQDVLRQMRTANNGSSQPNLSAKSVSAYEIPLVTLAEQREFADFATRVDKLRLEAQKQKEELQTLYDSLAQEYFG